MKPATATPSLQQLDESDLAQITGGEDDGGDGGGGGGGGGEPAYTCESGYGDDGQIFLNCSGPFGDDVLNQAGRCLEIDQFTTCFI